MREREGRVGVWFQWMYRRTEVDMCVCAVLDFFKKVLESNLSCSDDCHLDLQFRCNTCDTHRKLKTGSQPIYFFGFI